MIPARVIDEPRKLVVRPYADADIPAIKSSWLESNRKASVYRHMRNGIYFDNHAPLVNRALSRCGALVVEAQSAPGELLGWICAEQPGRPLVVHFVYVYGLYRRSGVATKLMEAIGYKPGDEIIATHVTHVFEDWKVRDRHRITNNPYLFWRQ